MKAALLALMLAGCAVIPVEQAAKPSAVVLGLTGEGSCSGTMIGPRVLLSAAHCFEGSALLTVNMVPVNVVEYRHDGLDHALLTLDTDFPAHSPLNTAGMAQGASVFIYGNPNSINDLLRRGYVVGGDAERTLIDMSVSHGDSGAGVFNDKGEVVGVITGFGAFSSGMRLALVQPFTKPVSEWALVIEE